MASNQGGEQPKSHERFWRIIERYGTGVEKGGRGNGSSPRGGTTNGIVEATKLAASTRVFDEIVKARSGAAVSRVSILVGYFWGKEG